MRQIVLDTETTGLDPTKGHRIIEIGCLELVNRRVTGARLHEYLQPDRPIDPGAIAVHGISNEFLLDKPRFSEVAERFLEFVDGAELIIHNAPFDIGFINHELGLMQGRVRRIEDICGVLDTLQLARQLHPGSRNSLDALCKRYQVDASGRVMHGAALDAGLLADVYLCMTGGQVVLSLDQDGPDPSRPVAPVRVQRSGIGLRVIAPSAQEQAAHAELLALLDRASGALCQWRQMPEG
jgi:DNA polymerase III subunit epsilon